MPRLDRNGRAFFCGRILVALLVCVMGCDAALGAQAESLEAKLAATTDYVPQSSGPVERLIEVGQKFNIPMAVEWVERAEAPKPDGTLPAGRRSVRELIEEIIGVQPEHHVDIEGGLLRVHSPSVSAHPFNFLNIVLDTYSVKDDTLFAAQDRLRWAIRFTLEPEKYQDGFAGGFGEPANDVFAIPRITLSASDLTIREALNQIALAQGNAMWVATIRSADLQRREPFWKRAGADGKSRGVTSGWHFYPLADVSELAKEQVAVDVLVEGLLDRRMTTIPVILAYGLTGDSGGVTGGSTSEGDSYRYSASLEKADLDSVKLSVKLTVRRRGEMERRFEEEVEVIKGQLTELRLDPRITIKAYLEPR